MPETILVVDDDVNTARITERMLTVRGYDVMTATDGTRALELVAERTPDCILLDIMMPRMSGLEVLNHLKHDPETAEIPVILLTAKSQDEDVLTGYREGAEYYITKPFTAQELLYGIGLVLARSAPTATRASPPLRGNPG